MVENFSQWLREEERKSEHTIYNYQLAIQGYLDWFSGSYDKIPDQLFTQNIRDYMNYLKNVQLKSASNINARLSALQKYNEYLVKIGVQKELLAIKKHKIKIQKKYNSPTRFEEKEVKRFLQTVLEGGNKRDYALVTLLAYAGCRISEALHIQIQRDLHLHTRELVIRSGKGEKERTVMLSKRVVEAIKDYLEVRKNHRFADSPYLFVSNKGRQFNRFTANDMFDSYSEKAKLEQNLTPHDLRHFFCTYALENGFDVHEVANMAGHTNIQTTLLYTNPSRKKMIDKLDRL